MIYSNILKHLTVWKLTVSVSNTWNYLIVRKKFNSGSFKNYLINKLFIYKIYKYIFDIYV